METAGDKLRQSRADDAKCRSDGAKSGDTAYVQCMAKLDEARATLIEAAAPPTHADADLPGVVSRVSAGPRAYEIQRLLDVS